MIPRLDLSTTFFSRRGAFLSIRQTDPDDPETLTLHHLRGGVRRPALFRLTLVRDGAPVPCQIRATPAMLEMSGGGGQVAICFESETVLRIAGEGVGLRLTADTAATPFDCALPHGGGRWEVNAYDSGLKCLFIPLQGDVDVDTAWNGLKATHLSVTLSDDGAPFDLLLQTYTSTPPPYRPVPSFAAASAAVAREFAAWREATLPVPVEYEAGRTLAAYVNWAGIVAPEGFLTRPAMFMSKNQMTKIWGWDNCFNAIAHVEQDPQLAWDQLMLFVDNQGADGALPDHITDANRSFRFYKPPVYGWALTQMQARSGWISDDRLAGIYPPLCRWTDWWFVQRDDDGDGLPQYNHGNESGWDNGTPFARFLPVESPDLATFLILQMVFLADTAERLGRAGEGGRWRERADRLQQRLLAELWTGERFIARHALTHEAAPAGSLLLLTPLLLGRRLPAPVRTALLNQVDDFLTPHGLASERPDSPFYTADGYWRGPIWAPSTYLLVDGLRRCGAGSLAREVSRRFCRLALGSGMAENYDALSGDGLRDRAYTWTAGVFLLLGNQLLRETEPDPSPTTA